LLVAPAMAMRGCMGFSAFYGAASIGARDRENKSYLFQ